jgi:DNA polymerase-4
MTFPEDVEDIEGLKSYLLLLVGKVGRRARRWECAGRTVSLYVRFSDFSGVGKRKTLEKPISLDADIFCAATNILETVLNGETEPSRPVRLLGVSLSNLTYRGLQLPLLSRERKELLLNNAIDAVNDLFGDESLTYATVSEGGTREAGVISPAWRPEGTRRVDPR